MRAASEWTLSYVATEAVPRSAGREVRFAAMSPSNWRAAGSPPIRETSTRVVALLQLGFAPESLARSRQRLFFYRRTGHGLGRGKAALRRCTSWRIYGKPRRRGREPTPPIAPRSDPRIPLAAT